MTLIDTNILIDIMTEDRRWFTWSHEMMQTRSDQGALLINDVVYAELSARFNSEKLLDETIRSMDLALERLPKQSLYLAGRAFSAYRAAGGPRTSILSDFFIGAHADVAGLTILTRDVRRYRTYFPDVALIAPDET